MPRNVLIGIARMASTRLPGKVLTPLHDSMSPLHYILTASLCCNFVDDFVIATTTDPLDDAIAEWCKNYSVECYRAAPGDVLARFLGAAEHMKADVAIRVTCDCPFQDPRVIDQVVALREATDADYCCNTSPPTWPDGLDVEAIKIGVLRACQEALPAGNTAMETGLNIDRSCVTTWIERNRYRFKVETLICPLPGMHKERWVLDTVTDLALCKEIAAECGPVFDWLSIKKYLDDKPWLREINAHHPRNERFYAALAKEPLPPRSYTNSKRLLERAEKIIPLGTQTFSKSKIQYPSESPLWVTHADGGYCFDVDGNRFVDLVGGLLPVILGARDPDVDFATRRQQNLGNCFSLATELEVELSELLCRLIPCAEMVRLGKNGSDVTSAAVRLARVHTGRSTIISSGYHGWHDWAVAWDEIRNKGVVEAGRYVLPLTHGASSVLRTYSGVKPAAVIVEPETDPEFLKECRKFCDETGALLIFDEVITGFRFDLGGAQKLYGVTPDLACFGKSMANGWPISALVGKREYMKTMEKTSYSGTFFGDPISIAAALATIKKLEAEDVLTKIKLQQMNLLKGIGNDLLNQHIRFPGYIGLPRLTFPDNDIKALFIQEMAQQGVLIIASHNLCYAHGDNEIERVVTAYKHVLPLIAEAVESGSVKQLIKGRSIPAHANVRATT